MRRGGRAKSLHRAGAGAVRSGGFPLMPLRLRIERLDGIQQIGRAGRTDGLGEDADARALLRLLIGQQAAQIAVEPAPCGNFTLEGERAGAVGIV